MALKSRYEVVIVGGGIAGASVGYFLARQGVTDVLILEREAQLAVHSTGRSAASISELDDNQVVFELKTIGSRFWRDPPSGFMENAPLKAIGVLSLFAPPAWSRMRERATELRAHGLDFEFLEAHDCRAKVPPLEMEGLSGGILVPHDGRLDVHGILQAYLRHARNAGIELQLDAEVLEVLQEADRVVGVRLAAGEIRCEWLVDAAGAWAGEVAAMAGATALSLEPRRRSLFTFPPPGDVDFEDWPMVWSDPHSLYFVPEAGELMLSPMDQVPMGPCAPSPDDETIAASIERLASLAPALVPKTIRSSWSGLRTFASDGAPVIGPDPTRPGFFWCAGQGGAGIETSPAYGRFAADLLAKGRSDVFEATRLAPNRLA